MSISKLGWWIFRHSFDQSRLSAFPHVYRNDRKQPQVYTECFYRGYFIQYLSNLFLPIHTTLVTDILLAEFTREFLLDQAGDVGIPDYRALQALLARFQRKMSLEIHRMINMYSKFIVPWRLSWWRAFTRYTTESWKRKLTCRRKRRICQLLYLIPIYSILQRGI